MVAPASETVEYKILLQAAEAMRQLQQMSAHASNFHQKIVMATAATRKFGQDTGLSMKNSVSVLREMDQVMAEANNTQQVFGNLGKEGWNSVATAAEQGSRRTVRSIDAIRIALGVLVSMLIFQVMQAFSNAFRIAIENLRETELAIYNLINAERRLSEMGIDVTPKGLQETIDGIQKLVPILSRIQAEELVSRIATNVAPALKFTDEQIRQLSESVALLYVRNKALGYSFDEIEKAITDAFLTGKVSQGINKFGVKLSDQIVRDEALRLGLVKTAEEFDNLTGEMEAQVKAAAMLSAVYKNATQDVGSLDEYMKTTDATIESTKAVWNDFLTILGEIASPVIQESLAVITRRLESMKAWLESNKQEVIRLVAAFAGLARGVEFLSDLSFMERMTSPIQNFKGFIQAVYDGMQQAKEGMTDLGNAADTPTEAIDNLQNTLDNFDASGFRQEIDDILKDAAEAQEDLDTKLSRKLEDLDEEYIEKAEDAYRDYQRKVEDINLDAERRRADALRKSREDDLKAERDYQNKLWELRMRYLMDLEDALHARDARQIIRLQKQYAIDKEALLRKKKLDDQSRQDDLQAELEQIERQRQQKLEDAKRDYEQKLADQRKAKQRELEDLNVWYAREQADLRQHLQRKMQDLINAWIQEGKITQAGAEQVYAILLSYFGPGGLTDQLYQYMQSQLMASMSIPGNIPVTSFGQIGSNSGSGNRAPRTPATGLGGGTTPFAEGGTLIAARPMTATFGEVPEAVTFTPLDKPGNNVGRLFGDKSGIGGGMLEVLLTLSPDLEHRIVQKSLDGAADVIVKVNRSRV